jgi:hypothetical protein
MKKVLYYTGNSVIAIIAFLVAMRVSQLFSLSPLFSLPALLLIAVATFPLSTYFVLSATREDRWDLLWVSNNYYFFSVVAGFLALVAAANSTELAQFMLRALPSFLIVYNLLAALHCWLEERTLFIKRFRQKHIA